MPDEDDRPFDGGGVASDGVGIERQAAQGVHRRPDLNRPVLKLPDHPRIPGGVSEGAVYEDDRGTRCHDCSLGFVLLVSMFTMNPRRHHSIGPCLSVARLASQSVRWARRSSLILVRDTRELTPSLSKMWRRWLLTVCGEMYSVSAISRLVSPSDASRATAASAVVRASQPVAGRSALTIRRRTPSRLSRRRTRAASQLAPARVLITSARSSEAIASPPGPSDARKRPRSSSADAVASGRGPASKSDAAVSR